MGFAMTAPSAYLRDLREQQASRRLGVAKVLRETPDATNLELAKIFKVNRNTIAADRKAIVNMVKNETKTEIELLRDEMVEKLHTLESEVEQHRKRDGKLPLAAVDRLLDITKAVIELLGVRKPVAERLNVQHKFPTFQCVPGPKKKIPIAQAEVITEPNRTLGDGNAKP